MKIAFVTTHLTDFGGAKNVVLDYANALSEAGHDILIIAQKINRNNFQFKKRISLIEIGGKLPSSPFYWIRFKLIQKKYIEALNKQDFDVLFSHLFPCNYFCSLIQKKYNFKHINYCHEPFRYFYDKKFYSNVSFLVKILSFFLRLFFKKYDIEGCQNADNIICNSNFTKEKAKKCYNRDSYVLYPVLNFDEKNNMSKIIDFNQKFKIQQKKPILFTLGLTHHMKGAKELILIFNKIISDCPDTILLIGGWMERTNANSIKKLIKKLKIPHKNILFIGPFERKYLGNFYNLATLTLFTAIDEPFGLIPLESMSYGTPVIAFEGGPSETIQYGKTGYVIKNNDLDEFANQAIKIIKDDSLRKKLGEQAEIHTKKNFNFEKSVRNLEGFFKKTISNSEIFDDSAIIVKN